MLHRLIRVFSSTFRSTARSVRHTDSRELTLQELEGRVVPAAFDFAGFNWDDDNTPDTSSLLGVGPVPDGFGAIITAEPTDDTSIVAFPNPPVDGFNDDLALGVLALGNTTTAPPDGDESRALNLPDGNQGFNDRSGIELTWSGGRLLPNLTGNDFVVYESGSSSTSPEAFMVQVHSASTNTWSKWRYEASDSFESYTGGASGGFAHAFDLSDFGLASSESIDRIRIANMTDEDRMEDASGMGFVIPEDDDDTTSFLPNGGAANGNADLTGGALDPDPLYVASLHTVAAPPDLSITKTDGVTEIALGQSTTYTIVVTNNSSFTVTGATVTDNFPAELTNVSYTSTVTGGATGNTANGTGDINDVLTLPAGSTVTYTVDATVALDASGTIANTAMITPVVMDTNPADNTATDTNTVIQPDLSITKNGSLVIDSTQSPNYVIVVTNNSSFTVTGATVTDNFPAELTSVSYTSTVTGGATGNTANGTGDINDVLTLPAGSTVTYTVTTTLASGVSGEIINTATIATPAPQVDANPANNTANWSTAVLPIENRPNIVILKTDGVDQLRPGESTLYQIVVRNNSAFTVTGANVIDNFPTALKFVSYTSTATDGATGNTAAGVGNINDVLTLPANSMVTYTVFARAGLNAAGTIENTATVTLPDPLVDPNPANNTATDTNTVVQLPAIHVVGSDRGQVSRVLVFDAATGETKFDFQPYISGFTGGVRVAVGDINGDFIPDIITAAGPGGGPHVKVFDGQTGDEIRSFFAYTDGFTGGVFVAAGDVNGDGITDIITGAGSGGGPHVRIFSGDDLSVINEFFVFANAFTGGVRVASGDVNDDGFADLVMAAGPGGGPHVRVFGGGGAGILGDFFAYQNGFTGGVFVAVGDTNGDGLADIITGAGEGGGPHVKVLDSAFDLFNPLTLLNEFFAYEDDFSGGVRVAATDVNADGMKEVVTGEGPPEGPQIKIFNNASTDPIDEFFAFSDDCLDGGPCSLGVFVG